MSAEQVAEVPALPQQDRALLVRQLIASLDNALDDMAGGEWEEVIARRSREIESGAVLCRPIEEIIREIRGHDLHPM